MTTSTQAPILVTGASGFIASWIVKYLLEGGHTVHGTVRNPDNAKKVSHLTALQTEFGSDKLKLFKADLLDEGSFDQAMEGCEIVMHTASPFLVGKIKDPQKQLIEPALKGTENVLNSVNRTDSVKRVVLTSSVAATYGDAIDATAYPDRVINDSNWNTSSSLSHQPYSYSKTVAEKRAWEIAKAQDRWDMVTINPSFVMGPSLSGRMDSASQGFLKQLINGGMKAGAPNLFFGFVDVREIANAHIAAGLKPEAKGRYIMSSKTLNILELSPIIEAAFPGKFKLPKGHLPKLLLYFFGPLQGFSWKFVKNNIGIPFYFDHSRSLSDLGIKFRPIAETLKDHVSALQG